MDVKIYTVAHKTFSKPEGNMYVPIIVGGNEVFMEGSIRDNCNDNIAHLNKTFCEMTAIYWIWKNSSHKDDDVIGISHYRRYFKSKCQNGEITEEEIKKLLSFNDIIIPKKRNYYVTTVKKHYEKAHYKDDLNILKNIIKELEPSYLDAFNELQRSRKLCLYNMCITRFYIFKKYCDWVFPILFELEKKIGYENYDDYQKRVVGFLAERLFNVWLIKNNEIYKVSYQAVYNTDGDEIIKKGFNFIKRQFLR